MKSVYDAIKAVVSVFPISASSVQTGTYVDSIGYNSAMIVVNVGAATGSPTGQTVDAKVQESDSTGSGFVDITGATMTQITADSQTGLIRVDGLANGTRKRYLRVLVTPALTGGSSPKSLVSATILLGRAYQEPVN